MDCPGNSWIWVIVLEKWAAFDAPYQSFGTWIETLKQQNEFIWIEGKIRGYDGAIITQPSSGQFKS